MSKFSIVKSKYMDYNFDILNEKVQTDIKIRIKNRYCSTNSITESFNLLTNCLHNIKY